MRNRYHKSCVIIGSMIILCGGLSGCGAEAPANETNVIYICRETNELIRAPRQPTPAVHPETGRKTLVPALYCKQCEQWRAVPPSQAFNRNPLSLKCPKHKGPLSPDGPIPEGDQK